MKLKTLLEMPNAGNTVYHATNLEVIKSILDTNVLRADTHHAASDVYPELKQNPEKSGKEIQGVSLTRDKNFADKWSDVILVLDMNKIKQNYKVKQVAYFADDAQNNREESEEFVIGSIKNLNRYLIGIHFPARLEADYTNWKWVQQNIKPIEQEFAGWKAVLEHPKYNGKQMMSTKKAVGEMKVFLDETGRIVAGSNTPPGITVDHTKKMAAAFGNVVNKDGYAPIMPTDGKINREAPPEKNHADDDKKANFTGPDMTPLTSGSGPDMVDKDNVEEPKDVELGDDKVKDELGVYTSAPSEPLEHK